MQQFTQQEQEQEQRGHAWQEAALLQRSRLQEIGLQDGVLMFTTTVEIKNAMDMFKSEWTVIASACQTIGNLAVNGGNNQTTLMKSGLVERVLDAMIIHQEREGVIVEALWALLRLADDAGNRTILMRRRVSRVVTKVMRIHKDSVDVGKFGCWALGNLAANVATQTELVRGNVHRSILATMAAHARRARVAEYGCRALGFLAINEVNRTKLMAAGAAASINFAFYAHGDNLEVIAQACWAFRYLVVNSFSTIHNQESERIQIAIGERLLGALSQHGSDPGVSQHGLWALGSLACNNHFIKEELLRMEAIPIVQKVMTSHEGDEIVLEAGLRVRRVLDV